MTANGLIFTITFSAVLVMGGVAKANSGKQLPDVEVREEASEGSLQRHDIESELRVVPGGTNIVDLDKIKGNQATLDDVLSFQPGIILQEFFGGNDQPRLNIRGSGIQDNPVSRGIQLLYDGMPLNQADGSFIIGLLDPEQAMLISIFRGANGMQYGASTLGGAINFIQRSGLNSPPSLRLEAGSYNAFNGNVSVGGKQNNWDYFLQAGHDRGDGFRPHNEGERSNLLLNLGYGFDAGENRTLLHYTDNFFQSPFLLPKDRAISHPDSVLGDGDTALDRGVNIYNRDPFRDTQQLRLGNKTTLRQQNSDQTFGVYVERVDDYFKNPLQHVITESTTTGVEYSYRLFDEHDSEHGSEYQIAVSVNHGDMPREYFANDPQTGQRLHRFAHLDLQANNLVMGAQAVKALSDPWQLVASLQWVYNERNIEDLQTPGLLDGDFLYRSINPKLGLIYHLDENARIFANVSRSSEAPTFWQLVTGLGDLPNIRQAVGLNKLQLQESLTLEIGSQGSRYGLSWQVNYFYSWIENELISEINDNFALRGRTVNYSDDTYHQGVEVYIQKRLSDNLLLANDRLSSRFVYNFADYRFEGGRYQGNHIAGIPKHLLQAELIYDVGNGFSILPNLKWQPEDAFADHVNVTLQEAYALWGLKLDYRLNKVLRLYADLDNLTDEVYQSSYVIHGSAIDTSGDFRPSFIPGAGFNFTVGLFWQW